MTPGRNPSQRAHLETLEITVLGNDEQALGGSSATRVAEHTAALVELAVHDNRYRVTCIIPLPNGHHVAATSCDDKVSILSVTAGALEHEVSSSQTNASRQPFGVFEGNTLAAGGNGMGSVAMWDVFNGIFLGEAVSDEAICSACVLHDAEFVVATRQSAAVVYHHDGRDLEEIFRVKQHKRRINGYSIHQENVASESRSRNGFIWSVVTRKNFGGTVVHPSSVTSVDMNDRMVAIGTQNKKVRVYKITKESLCITVPNWPKDGCVPSLAIFRSDVVVTSTRAGTNSGNRLSTTNGAVIGRNNMELQRNCVTALSGSRLAISGDHRIAELIDATTESADLLMAPPAIAFPCASGAAFVLSPVEPAPSNEVQGGVLSALAQIFFHMPPQVQAATLAAYIVSFEGLPQEGLCEVQLSLEDFLILETMSGRPLSVDTRETFVQAALQWFELDVGCEAWIDTRETTLRQFLENESVLFFHRGGL
jgi:hypothetical protein